MRCQLCLNLSWQPLCKNCLGTILYPQLSKRTTKSGLDVYSFYKYSEIKELLHTKHTYQGNKIFIQLSKNSFLPFVKKIIKQYQIYALPIDDHVRSGYSHSAVLAKGVSSHMRVLYGQLRAKNKTRFSGQKLKKREKEKRNFSITCKSGIDVILVDDIITTGLTMDEAYLTCNKNGVNVLFGITLADAKEE